MALHHGVQFRLGEEAEAHAQVAKPSAFPVLQGITQEVVDKGQGDLADAKRFGTVYYNLGVVNGILNVWSSDDLETFTSSGTTGRAPVRIRRKRGPCR